MLKNLSLKNFKGFELLNDIHFKPITILCGVNSSGKSSILKSLLLLKQTIMGQQLNSGLLLNGKYVKLGAFENIIYSHDLEKEIEFSLNYSFDELKEILRKSRIKMILKDFFNIDISKKNPKNLRFSFTFKYISNDFVVSRLSIEGNDVSIELIYLEKDKYILNCKNICNFSENSITKEKKIVEVRFNYPLIPAVHFNNDDSKDEQEFKFKRSVDMMFYYSNNILTYLLDQITYIGPLRKEPERRYIYEDEILSIGNKGENAAFIYAKEKNTKISSYFYNVKKNQFDYDTVKLSTALNRWLKLMNINDFDNNQFHFVGT